MGYRDHVQPSSVSTLRKILAVHNLPESEVTPKFLWDIKDDHDTWPLAILVDLLEKEAHIPLAMALRRFVPEHFRQSKLVGYYVRDAISELDKIISKGKSEAKSLAFAIRYINQLQDLRQITETLIKMAFDNPELLDQQHPTGNEMHPQMECKYKNGTTADYMFCDFGKLSRIAVIANVDEQFHVTFSPYALVMDRGRHEWVNASQHLQSDFDGVYISFKSPVESTAG